MCMAADRLPNFFLVGAPKCGTTALWQYLSTHPSIFMGPLKEPHYFNFDHNYHWVSDRDAYEQLFAGAPLSTKVIGEGSVWYLYSNAAVPEILRTVEDPRFVVMIRNPLDMFQSLHEQLIVSGRENIEDAEEAWAAQDRRGRGIDLPVHCMEPLHLQYRQVCSLGTQLERLLAAASPQRVHWVLFDDFARDASTEYARVLAFLGLEDDGRKVFPRVNSAKGLRWRFLQRLTRAARKLKRASGVRSSLGIVRLMKKSNIHFRSRAPLRPEFRSELARLFDDEIAKLEAITGRNLEAWRRP